jgi:hypothetical protein
MDRYRPEAEPTPTKACPECTTKIPEKARRCPQCAAQLQPPSAEVVEAMRLAAAPSGAQLADEAAKALAERLQPPQPPQSSQSPPPQAAG